MSTLWRISDLIDLDFFLRQAPEEMDGAGKPDTASDRDIFLGYAKAHTPPFKRRDLIRYWLDEKRAGLPKDRPLPGEIYRETMALMRILAAAAAFALGAVLAWSVLSYSGAMPINIFTCLWILVAPQLLLLGLLGISSLLSRLGVKGGFMGLYPAAALLFRRLAIRIGKAGDNVLTAETRLRFSALFNLADLRRTIYGPVFFWPFFLLAQLTGIWFNLGILAAVGLKLAITDLAFGWQSTLFVDPATIHRLLGFFSLPWSWAVASAHPALSQIEGSRMILKEGMVHLATPDLVSWWPFLIYAILCYGLIPRGLLLAWGVREQRRALLSVSFSTGQCDRLIQRLQTPRLRTAGEEMPEDPVGEKQNFSANPSSAADGPLTGPMGPAIALVPGEIDAFFTDPALKERLSSRLGLNLAGRLPLTQDTAVDSQSLRDLLSRQPLPPDDLRLVILTEAWQPPLKETVSWLAGLRQAVGPATGMIIGLVGKPGSNGRFTGPAPVDRTIWERATAGLNDPFLRIESLGGGHE